MKLVINQDKGKNDMEIVINCPTIDKRVRNLIDYIRQYTMSIVGVIDGTFVSVPLETILYFESVDRKTFFYDKCRVFQGRESLVSLENKLDNSLFVRISKSCIVNIAMLSATFPLDNHKLGITLKTGERLVVGRVYVENLEARLNSYHLTLENKQENSTSEYIENVVASIRNNNEILHFHKKPQRIVAVTYTCAELLCALGLEDRIIGVASLYKDIESVLPMYREKLKNIPTVHCTDINTGELVPIKQDIKALEPDFVLSNHYYQKYLLEKNQLKPDFPMFVMESSVPERNTIDMLYRDIINIGKIFGVENEAIRIVEEMRDRIVNLPVGHINKDAIKVFVYDSGMENPVTACRDTLENQIILLSGGLNIFGERKGMYQKVEWKEVVQYNPDYIIIHDYTDSMDVQEKREWICSYPGMNECEAVKKNRIIVLNLSEVFPGIQNAITVEKLHGTFSLLT